MYRYLLHILILLLVAFPLRAEEEEFDPVHPGDPNAAYGLTLISSPADAATLKGGGTYANTSSVTIQCEPHTGYAFQCWMNGQEVFATTATHTFLMPSQQLTLTAQLQQLELQNLIVTTNLPDAAQCTGSGQYYPGEQVQIACAPNTDYHFQYWTLNGQVYTYESSFLYTVGESSADFVAVFTHTPHVTLTIQADDATSGYVTHTGGRLPVGQTVTVTAISYTDCVFTHWTLNGQYYSDQAQITHTVGDTDEVLEAVFDYDPLYPDEPNVELTSTIRLQCSPAGAATFNLPAASKYHEGDTLVIHTQMNSGYVFEGWYLGKLCISQTLDFVYVVGKNDATLTLRATPIIYSTLILQSDPAGAVVFNIQSEGTYEAGTPLNIRAAVQQGYLFHGWYLGDSLLTSNIDLAYVVPEQGTILVAKATYIPGEGEEDDDWDPLPPGEPELETVQVTLLPSDPTMGKTVGSASYVVGDTITIKAIPNNGYLFEQWSDGVTEPTRTLIVEQAIELTAHFTPKMYQVTLVCNDEQMGSVTGEGYYAYRSNATIIATPAEGYVFQKWSDENTDMVHNIYVTSDTVITAYFSELKYQITVLADDRLGSVTGGGWYNIGDTVTLTATPEYGCTFIKWADDVLDNPRTIVVTQDQTFTALFSGEIHADVEDIPSPKGNCQKLLRNGMLIILLPFLIGVLLA